MKAALDHAHGLTGGAPGTGLGDAAKPAFPMMAQNIKAPVPTAADSVAPPPVTAMPMEQVGAQSPGAMSGATPLVPGLREIGNTPLNNRPELRNPNGTTSTMSTASFGTDKGETLIPTVVNGKRLSNDDALGNYEKTGQHMGIFDTPENADNYAESMHRQFGPNYSAESAPPPVDVSRETSPAMPLEPPPSIEPTPLKSADLAPAAMPLPIRGPQIPYQMNIANAPRVQTHQDEYSRLAAPPLSGNDPNAHTPADTGQPGWEQIHNPFLRTLAGVGNGLLGVASRTALGQGIAQNIPGTSAHHQVLVNQQEHALGEEQAGAKSAADVAKTEADTEHAKATTAGLPAEAQLHAAEAQNYISEAEARKNPDLQVVAHPVIDPNDTTKTPRTGYFNKKTGTMTYGPEIAATPASQQRTTFEKMDDGTVLALSVGPDGKATHSVVYKGDPKVETDLAKLKIGGQEHSVIVNKKTGETIKDLGETGEKPPTVNVNAETSALDRESARFAKPHEANVKAANDQLEKIIEAHSLLTTGNAESQALAVPKVLTALVSGQGTGVRITQPELNAIGAARGITGDVKAWIQKLGSGKKLTPEQSQQLVGVLDAASQRLEQKREIANHALDLINSGTSRADIIKADAEARKALADFEKGGGNAPHKIASDDEYNKLPKGAHFVGPDGKERVKP